MPVATPPGSASSREIRLLEGFDAITFSYQFDKLPGEEPVWVDASGSGMPAPARVKVELEYRGRKYSRMITLRARGVVL